MLPLPSLLFAAAAVTSPVLRAERTDKPPVVDGRVDEDVWKKTSASTAFTQKVPEDGKAPAEPTTVRVLYDDTAIYVAIECVQKKAKIVAPLTRRDREIESDSVSVALATRGDGTTAFEFSINPAGVIADATRFDDTSYSRDWDENWVGQAAVTKDGWSAELAIPLRILRFEERPVQSFGLQVRRYTSARKESVEWSYIPRSETGEVSRYGKLENLVGLKKGASVEVRPFLVYKIGSRDPEYAPRSHGFYPGFSAGADFKWLPLPSLTIDGTINPDFGQVEADKVVLNLSSFETYFPEKRPFFLEAADVFTTPMQLVYTRRIGRAVYPPVVFDGAPCSFDDGDPDNARCQARIEEFRSTPEPSPIYGALKLTGNLGEKWSVGALFALSGGSSAETSDGTGRIFGRTADPLTTFKVLRVRRNFEGGHSLGIIGTAVSRLETPTVYPPLRDSRGEPVHDETGRAIVLCPGGEELPIGERCFHNAYALGVDGRLKFGAKNYVAIGQVAGTLISGGPERQQADGTVIRSGDLAPAARLQIRKDGGGHIRAGWTGEFRGKNVDYNDLGFMQRQNLLSSDLWAEYDTNGPAGGLNDGFIGGYLWESDTLDLLNTGRGGGVFMGAQFKNFWRSFTELHAQTDHWDDREMGDGAALERPGLVGLDLGVNTDERSTVSLALFTSPRILTNGGVNVFADASLKVRALPQLELELAPSFTYTHGEPRFYDFSGDGTAYLFGKLEAASLSATLSATYTFLPTLTLQVYGQAFAAFGHYSEFSRFPIGDELARITLGDLVAGDMEYDPDFVTGTFNANVVARWEYRLGSTIYFVYTHGQDRGITPAFRDKARFDFKLVEPRPAADVFLLKASYWWG